MSILPALRQQLQNALDHLTGLQMIVVDADGVWRGAHLRGVFGVALGNVVARLRQRRGGRTIEDDQIGMAALGALL